MASTAVVLGVSLAVVGLGGRHLLRRLPDLEKNMSQVSEREKDTDRDRNPDTHWRTERG